MFYDNAARHDRRSYMGVQQNRKRDTRYFVRQKNKMTDKNNVIVLDHVTKIYKLFKNDKKRFLATFIKSVTYREKRAINDVSFSVKKGESVALFGRNGAGKSTILKMITGVSFPTYGKIHVKGRVGALLELTAGFDPEFSGRENIYLKGQLTGIDRIKKMIKDYGTTLLLVTHSTATAKQFCDRGIVLRSGRVLYDGDISDAIYLYNESLKRKEATNLTRVTSESDNRIKHPVEMSHKHMIILIMILTVVVVGMGIGLSFMRM